MVKKIIKDEIDFNLKGWRLKLTNFVHIFLACSKVDTTPASSRGPQMLSNRAQFFLKKKIHQLNKATR